MTGALPHRLVRDPSPAVEWVWSDGGRFSEPFFEDTVVRLRQTNPANRGAIRPQTPLAALREIPEGLPVAGLIFHVSRCGSTLLARMLAAVPHHLVASEPQIVDDLLRLDLPDSPIAESERIALLRGAVNALSQPPAGGASRLFIKLDCWHLFSLPLLRRTFPDAPLIFVYRDPLEVLVSLMRRPSLTLVRGTVTPEQLGVAAHERDRMSAEEHAAAILGAFYRTASFHRRHLIPIGYRELPQAATTRIPALALTDDEREAMLAAANSNAKSPGEVFQPDAEDKRREASPKIHAALARWTAEPYAHWLAGV